MKTNGFGDNWRAAARSSTIWNDLSKQIGDGDAGNISFSYPAADRKSKITVTIKIRGDEDETIQDGRVRQDWAWEIARSFSRAGNAPSSVINPALNKDKLLSSQSIGETAKDLKAAPLRLNGARKTAPLKSAKKDKPEIKK